MSAGQAPVIWQQRPCWLWCARTHGHYDGLENRACSTEAVSDTGIGLSMWQASPVKDRPVLPGVVVDLEQEPREAEPRVILSGPCSDVIAMTVDEARRVRALLGEKIGLAERGMTEEQS